MRKLTCVAVVAVVIGLAPASTGAETHRRIVAFGANQSNNWSGYNQGLLEKGESFHSVSGEWVVPTATQHSPGEAEYSSAWVGIGGGCLDADCFTTDSTLIQAGTEQDVDSSGRASYSTWWEIIPAPGIDADLAVKAGDRVRVTIGEDVPELWTITIQNLTTGGSFVQQVPYTSSYATAEWILETPVVASGDGVSVGPLPKLSTTTFDLAKTNGAPANLVASEAIQLVDFDGNVLATPSAPDAEHDGFRVCAYATTC